MPRIDALIAAMVSNRAQAVRLADGDVAFLMIGGTPQPLTRNPLAEGQLMALLREMAPAEIASQLGTGSTLQFIYKNETGRYLARLQNDGGTLRATVSPAPAVAPNGESHVSLPSPGTSAAVSPSGNGHPAATVNGNGDLATLAGRDRARLEPLSDGPNLAATAISDGVESDAGSVVARAEIDNLLKTLVHELASDLHLHVGEPPILRLHGELKRMEGVEPLTNSRLEAMLVSIMPERNLAEYRETHDTDFAYEIPDVARFRANALRDHHGAGGVFRAIPSKVATVEGLGISPEVRKLCFLTQGLVLVTGPTGSGKSTTLGGLVDLINRSRDDHVVTIEDPIEFVHKNKRCVITQRQVGLHTDSYKNALRAALREDPDIVLIGEMRDMETVAIALETAETGHLVFGTLHTTTAVGTIDRIIDQFPADRQSQIRVMLADTLKGVISQTLCRKIGGGRVAVREVLLSMPSVANMIREGKAFQIQSVMQTSRKLGMILLGDVLLDLVEKGIVEPKEAWMKATDKAAFLASLKTRGHDLSFAVE
ncbi:MAG TPA: PilT/PilU family type 4a pilus ATPase [Gemmatimonadaceae bacterium]|nr:PilT/PilU family type 4a pilus ATPase [Gemmatimonadaceae bacterium]